MKIRISKGSQFDTVAAEREDGSTVVTRFPKKGPLPHDAIHHIVEDVLGLPNAFWGMVAAGNHPDQVAAIAKAAGHASAKRADHPDPSIVQLLQAERLVECVEARAWHEEAGDPATFCAVAQAACAASHVPAPALDDAVIAALDARVAALSEDWSRGQVELEWPAR